MRCLPVAAWWRNAPVSLMPKLDISFVFTICAFVILPVLLAVVLHLLLRVLRVTVSLSSPKRAALRIREAASARVRSDLRERAST
jgi:hypothetical protein